MYNGVDSLDQETFLRLMDDFLKEYEKYLSEKKSTIQKIRRINHTPCVIDCIMQSIEDGRPKLCHDGARFIFHCILATLVLAMPFIANDVSSIACFVVGGFLLFYQLVEARHAFVDYWKFSEERKEFLDALRSVIMILDEQINSAARKLCEVIDLHASNNILSVKLINNLLAKNFPLELKRKLHEICNTVLYKGKSDGCWDWFSCFTYFAHLPCHPKKAEAVLLEPLMAKV